MRIFDRLIVSFYHKMRFQGRGNTRKLILLQSRRCFHSGIMQLIILFSVLTLASCTVNFQDCGSKFGSFSKVEVSGCNPQTMDACPLKKGTNATIIVTFATSDVQSVVKTFVHGVVAGVPIQFPLPNNDACKGSGLSCPLAAGATNQFTMSLPVLRMYPPIHVDVILELKSENDVDIICTRFPTKIK